MKAFEESGFAATMERVFNLDNVVLGSDQAWGLSDSIIATSFEFPYENLYDITTFELMNAKAYTHYLFYEGLYGNPEVVKLS